MADIFIDNEDLVAVRGHHFFLALYHLTYSRFVTAAITARELIELWDHVVISRLRS